MLRDNTVRIFRFQVIFTVNRFINMFICMSFCNVCVTVEQVIRLSLTDVMFQMCLRDESDECSGQQVVV